MNDDQKKFFDDVMDPSPPHAVAWQMGHQIVADAYSPLKDRHEVVDEAVSDDACD
jgi:hypothetical protein